MLVLFKVGIHKLHYLLIWKLRVCRAGWQRCRLGRQMLWVVNVTSLLRWIQWLRVRLLSQRRYSRWTKTWCVKAEVWMRTWRPRPDSLFLIILMSLVVKLMKYHFALLNLKPCIIQQVLLKLFVFNLSLYYSHSFPLIEGDLCMPQKSFLIVGLKLAKYPEELHLWSYCLIFDLLFSLNSVELCLSPPHSKSLS